MKDWSSHQVMEESQFLRNLTQNFGVYTRGNSLLLAATRSHIISANQRKQTNERTYQEWSHRAEHTNATPRVWMNSCAWALSVSSMSVLIKTDNCELVKLLMEMLRALTIYVQDVKDTIHLVVWKGTFMREIHECLVHGKYRESRYKANANIKPWNVFSKLLRGALGKYQSPFL